MKIPPSVLTLPLLGRDQSAAWQADVKYPCCSVGASDRPRQIPLRGTAITDRGHPWLTNLPSEIYCRLSELA